MPTHTQLGQRPSGRFWGLGWGMFYLASAYSLLPLLEMCLGAVAGWLYWLVFVGGAALSAFALSSAGGSPKGILKSLFYALHLLNLGVGIVGAVFGLIHLFSVGPP